MGWSWRVGTFAGIPVRIHITFLLLLMWIGGSYWIESRDFAQTAEGVFFLLSLFLCVVLHEFGHALTARRYGISTVDITLLPIGGLARLERLPEKPSQEFAVAIAGPLVNVAIALSLALLLFVTGLWEPLSRMSMVDGSFAQRLLIANVTLVLFNLIPAFPMDGGRMLRAALASRMHPVRATRAAATVGQTFAFLFGIAGLFGNPMLLLIALFVWIGAGQEAALAEMRFGFGSTPVSAIMLDQVRTLSPGDTLESAVDLTLHGWQQDFPVVEQGQLVGMLNRSDLLPALAGEGPTFPVEKAMQRQFLSAEPQEPLHSVIAKLQQCRCRSLAVVEKGRLVGLLAAESVGDFLRIQNALHSGRRA